MLSHLPRVVVTPVTVNGLAVLSALNYAGLMTVTTGVMTIDEGLMTTSAVNMTDCVIFTAEVVMMPAEIRFGSVIRHCDTAV